MVDRDNFQLQLKITGLPGAFDAGLCQCASNPESPPGFCDADAEGSPVPRFFRRIDVVDTGCADDLPVDFSQQCRIAFTFLFLLQVCFFLLQGEGYS